MKRLFIASDIHGFFDEWFSKLKIKGFQYENPDHVIVILGDAMDRGCQPKKILEFLDSLPEERKILIRGNHEDLMDKMLARGFAYGIDYSNGTFYTVADFYNIPERECTAEVLKKFSNEPLWLNYKKSLVDFWENDEAVFVHGYIPVRETGGSWDGKVVGPEYVDGWEGKDFSKCRWYNGYQLYQEGIVVPGKTIYFGHYHTSYAHHFLHNEGAEWDDLYYDSLDKPDRGPRAKFTTFKDKGIVGLDGCTAYSGIVNVEILDVKDEDVENGKYSNNNGSGWIR